MTVIRPNSISGITSITAQSGTLEFYTAAGNNLPISAATLNVGTGASVSSPATNVLTLGTNNVEIVRVTSNGNIGIGTTNPSNKLVISGTIGINELNAVPAYASTGRTLFSTSTFGFVLNHNDNSSIILQTQGTERVRITDSGHLILPAGSFDLMVGDSADSNAGTQTISVGSTASGSGGIQLWANPTNGNSYIQFGDNSAAASQYRGWVNYQHATDMLNFGTAGTERLRIDSGGRMTIPSQPMMATYQCTSGTLSVSANATVTLIPAAGASYDPNNNFDESTGIYTIPVSGRYYTYYGTQGKTAASTNAGSIYYNVNNTGAAGQILYYGEAYSGNMGAAILNLSANDTIRWQIIGNNGISYSLNGAHYGIILIG